MSAAAADFPPTTTPGEVWQVLHPAGTWPDPLAHDHDATFPATLPDGRQVVLPLRPLPDAPDCAVASLIIHQASFAVEDALMDEMAELAADARAEIVLAVPSLGLTLGNGVARRLGHGRMAALGTTRKFWYDDALSEPSSSISSRGTPKTLYLDPRLLPLLQGRRVAVVDDVISTGTSMRAVLRLLARAGAVPAIVVAAMVQSERWRDLLTDGEDDVRIAGVFRTPIFTRTAQGRWRPDPEGSAQ